MNWGHWWWEIYIFGGMGVATLYDREPIMSSFITVSHDVSINKKIIKKFSFGKKNFF